MNTSEVFTATAGGTNSTKADKWIEWDAKLFCLDASDNQIYYSATPTTAAPTFTANGILSQVAAGTVKNLETDVGADGSTIIYAGTTEGIFAHDYTNAKWVRPKITMPQHANGGKGFASWHSGLYYSSGLHVHLYIADNSPAIITTVGLDERDGLPTEYAGEIIAFVKGHEELYALVDASQVSGTGYSTIYGFKEDGSWRCLWADANADAALTGGIVSSSGTYNLWWNGGTTIYYMPLQRSLQNPLKVTGKTYAASGIHISPWFDADWQVGNKTAIRIKIDVGKDVSADESVIVSYRTNHTNTDRDTGWIAFTTITASGETTYTFGSSLGTSFRAIQFRFDLARKSADTDESPDVFYATLEYAKILPKKWGWQFTVDCTKPYNDKSPEQLLDALETAANLETLMAFMYEDVTKYVQVKSVTGSRLTGDGKRGEYTVFVQEL